MTAPNPAKLIPTIETLAGLISNYVSRPGRVNESNTIRALVTPMISALGWNIADLDEVQSEYRHKSTDNPVDYALFLEGAPSLFIEAKALDEKLDDRKWIVQTLNYANASNVEWAVLTNGVEWRVYNVHAKAEAEDKLFYTAHVDGADMAETARRLAMLSRDGMAPKRALDHLWREASVDRAMRHVIETLPDNRSAVRAMAKASHGLSEKDVREALRRLGLRADWRDEDDLFPAQPQTIDKTQTDTKGAASTYDEVEIETGETTDKNAQVKKIRIPQLIEAGLLSPGDVLHLRSKPEKIATVVDGVTCDFQGKRMSYNEWGCAATGWSAIRIYVQAETTDGCLLQDLREELASRS